MQTNSRYFTSIKIAPVLPVLVFTFWGLFGNTKRNPFCFSDAKTKVPFSYSATAKLHNCSKSFAILTSLDNKKIIAKKGDIHFGFKIIEINDDVLTVQDDNNNELLVPLK